MTSSPLRLPAASAALAVAALLGCSLLLGAAGEALPAEGGPECEADDGSPVVLLQQDFALSHRAMGGLEGDAHPDANSTSTGFLPSPAGDFPAFLGALGINLELCLFLVIAFMVLRVYHPLIYSYNVLQKTAPSDPEVNRAWVWWGAAVGDFLDQNIKCVGLDNGMLIEFTNISLRMMALLGIPMMVVVGSLNFFCGGNASGDDVLNKFSIANVKFGSPLYWFYVVVIWLVVVLTCRLVYKAQERFVLLRWSWLKALPAVRANTVLVGGIPEIHQADEELRQYFEAIFPGRVKSAYVVKDTKFIDDLVKRLEDARTGLYEAETAKAQLAIDHHTEAINELVPRLRDTKKQIAAGGKQPGPAGGNCCYGFVTFKDRADAEAALNFDAVSRDRWEFQIEPAPEPDDVDWKGLQEGPWTWKALRKFTAGWVLVVLLCIVYLPIVVFASTLGSFVQLGGLFQPIWEGFGPSLLLAFSVSFVPVFLNLIFKHFFTQKSKAWTQHRLQVWFFWFQLAYVIVIAAISQSIPLFESLPDKDREKPFHVIMDGLVVYATHFFMYFTILQWTVFALDLIRLGPLRRFRTWNAEPTYNEEEAKEKAEPEDQDYSGIGSRSSRLTINMLIALIFGTINPPLYLLSFVSFIVGRIVYGYLIPYAETRKADLGGLIWVTQLRQIYIGIYAYVVLMLFVLLRRAENWVPVVLVLPTLFYIYRGKQRFENNLRWERVPLHELMYHKSEDALMKNNSPTTEYMQPQVLVG